ncbi:restriction system modified-DNA reader domain-containing protein [Cellulomonas alba]|uniref:RAMA domain-containing protein n=1 Tax=Cellulomonas alba TaxID=3053467 RepID=A0ABT7SGL8_9CELL|nr:hypothetical protein [Cellulomonas alba]MDM7855343.1 hypothetical protein [Cellulomonas alba]
MPIFELDEGRPRLVQPMQPLPGSFGQDCAALLTHHLAAVAGEPLFVVRARSTAPEHADVPELLALDSTGRPVIVEVVPVVDDDAVVATLRHAGAAARMTTTDLARAYHPDPSRFPVDFAAFREQVAFGATTSRREGVRLVLLCSEVAAAAGDTLAFLRGPGRHVDVLQVGVVRGVDDRRMIDVSPLATHETVRRSVEPTALRLVRSSEAFATAMAYDSGRLNLSRPPMPGAVVNPPHRVSSPEAITPVTGVRVPDGAASRPTNGHTPAPGVPPVPAPLHAPLAHDPAELEPPFRPEQPAPSQPPHGSLQPPGQHLPAVSGGPRPLTPPHGAPPVAAPGSAFSAAPRAAAGQAAAGSPVTAAPSPAGAATGSTAGAPAAPATTSADETASAAAPPAAAAAQPAATALDVPVAPASVAWTALDAPAGSFPAPLGTSATSLPLPLPPAPARAEPERPAAEQVRPAAEPAAAPPGAPPERSSTTGNDGLPVPELATLAKRRRAITTLVWYRERRDQRLVALLRQDGLIQLPDGRTYADPDLAAAAAAGSLARIDGWRSWRMGDGGPTLAEAAGVPAT